MMANIKKDVQLSNQKHMQCIKALEKQIRINNSELWFLKLKIRYHNEVVNTQSSCNMVLNDRRKKQFYNIFVDKYHKKG